VLSVTLSIPGAMKLIPDVHADERGFMCVTGDTSLIPGASSWRWLMSRSATGVIRGLHVRSGGGENKLVRCSSGVIHDVIVDLRPSSPAYKTWEAVRLSGATQESVWIPAGCAHGYQVISGPADVIYHITGGYDSAKDVIIAHDDPDLGITWPLPVTVISKRDRDAPRLAEVHRKGISVTYPVTPRCAGGGGSRPLVP
jgi:dTDP-4-dehydrorhamnose 3,5-epimerase